MIAICRRVSIQRVERLQLRERTKADAQIAAVTATKGCAKKVSAMNNPTTAGWEPDAVAAPIVTQKRTRASASGRS